MAAEAQRATRSRERTSIALRPPRVVTDMSSMAHAAARVRQRRSDSSAYTGEPLALFEKVPGWAVVHAMTDDSIAPLLRTGEVAVVRSDGRAGWIAEPGNLYLIEYVSDLPCARYPRRTRAIVQIRRNVHGWWAGPLRSFAGGTIHMSDGPYADEMALADKLIGLVVGIYQPSAFEVAA